MATRRIAIMGAGCAGLSAACTLRDAGYDGAVVLFGDEGERPYRRPALSKAYLRGETTSDELLLPEAGRLDALDIELRVAAPVAAVDVAARSVRLASGERVAYDQLLLAPGAGAHGLALPGAGLDGVVRVRDLRDAEALRGRLAQAERAVVVGAGWLGMEVAAAARSLGLPVTLLAGPRAPLAELFGELHAGHGARIMTGPEAVAFEGDGRVRALRLSDGSRLACDVAVVAVGARPRTEVAERAGLAVRDGVLADSRLRTNAPGVFAAGDAARALHPRYGRHLRVEHWAAARHQGAVAARNMLGADLPQRLLPELSSELYGIPIEMHGLAGRDDRVVVSGTPADGRFLALWLRGRRVAAVMAVGPPPSRDALQDMVGAEAGTVIGS